VKNESYAIPEGDLSSHGKTSGNHASSTLKTRSRRRFLVEVGGATALLAGASTLPGAKVLADDPPSIFGGKELGAAAANRCLKSATFRAGMAQLARNRPLVYHTNNGDEDRYENKIGSYTKALPHNALGEVDLAAYATLTRAITTQRPEDFDAITLGLGRKLTSPQAGLAMDLQGPDSHHVTLPPAPRLDSAEEAGEGVELYWMALARDVNFADYNTSPVISRAVDDLSHLSGFRGPRENGKVTANTIFRNSTSGDLNGPWLSQFLTLDFPFGAVPFSQKIQTVVPSLDFMTRFEDWLAVQNGDDPSPNIQYDSTPRYIRNLRDIAQWVHVDALYQAYLHACLIMLAQGTRLDQGLPLFDSKAQSGFAQCGGPHVLTLVTEVATRALKAVWYQKWFVHHRLRPEEYGGLVHNTRIGGAAYPLHADILSSAVLDSVHAKFGTYLLPQAFPEGSPTHSSYGSGHATVAGACVTALKAFFDETDTVKNPMVPTSDGTALIPYDGPPLTIGGELNKVASNIANARNAAGIHWRTDAVNSLRLGEEIAIGILEEQKGSYNDQVSMTLTRFDGTQITI
jgi:hypothetical protein